MSMKILIDCALFYVHPSNLQKNAKYFSLIYWHHFSKLLSLLFILELMKMSFFLLTVEESFLTSTSTMHASDKQTVDQYGFYELIMNTYQVFLTRDLSSEVDKPTSNFILAFLSYSLNDMLYCQYHTP